MSSKKALQVSESRKSQLDLWSNTALVEVMHERNAHNFPLDLAAGDAAPVALSAPAING